MIVKLKADPNPDFDKSDHRGHIRIRPQVVEVADYNAASKVCRRFINEHDLGAGNWTGGDVIDGGALVARVSYDGRVWDTKNKEIEV